MGKAESLIPMMKPSPAAVVSVILILLLIGCGEEQVTQPTRETLPPNTSPEGALQRFVATFERMDSAAYSHLFTGDFEFVFSSAADPDLAQEYSSGWFKQDENIYAGNLFYRGGRYGYGSAQRINLDLRILSAEGDTASGRDTTQFKTILTQAFLTVQLGPSLDDPEGSAFGVGGADPAIHRFSLVRGDAAQGLSPGQYADAAFWYIWRWEDESEPYRYKETTGARSISRSTWGELKDNFRIQSDLNRAGPKAGSSPR
jgi:hypothetical protein